MQKQQIRKIYKQQRIALSEIEWQSKNQQILQHLCKWERIVSCKVIHLFLPIKSQKEPDLKPFVRSIWKKQINITFVISQSNFERLSLSHYVLTPQTVLEENCWGVPEPVDGLPFENLTEIDMVFVPLLAFDARGYRVGYGKGFYDRFLTYCPQACKVGISLFEALAEPIDDIDTFDVKLDFCITPQQIYDFSSVKS